MAELGMRRMQTGISLAAYVRLGTIQLEGSAMNPGDSSALGGKITVPAVEYDWTKAMFIQASGSYMPGCVMESGVTYFNDAGGNSAWEFKVYMTAATHIRVEVANVGTVRRTPAANLIVFAPQP